MNILFKDKKTLYNNKMNINNLFEITDTVIEDILEDIAITVNELKKQKYIEILKKNKIKYANDIEYRNLRKRLAKETYEKNMKLIKSIKCT